MGEEAVLHARSYALEAERKMGEMLAVLRPGRPRGEMVDGHDHFPTLEKIGVSKDESSRAQKMDGKVSPVGLFGEELRKLAKLENHRFLRTPAPMIYWSIDSLQKLAELEEIEGHMIEPVA